MSCAGTRNGRADLIFGGHLIRSWQTGAHRLVLLVTMCLATSGCGVYETSGVGRDLSNRWYAYRLVQGRGEGDGLLFFAVSKKRFKEFTFSIGEHGPRSVVVEGVAYKFPTGVKGNVHLVAEDGTVRSTPYRMTADEFHRFERHMQEIANADVLEALRRTLDLGRLHKEAKRFLELE